MTGATGDPTPNKPLTQVFGGQTYTSLVTTAEPNPDMSGEEMLRAAGFNLTEEGLRRARERRLAFEAQWTPEKWAALGKQLGMPETPA